MSCRKPVLKRTLCGAGIRPPTAQGAYDLLMQALQDQADWERRARAAKELLNDMVRSRRDAAQLAQQYDIKYVPAALAVCQGCPPLAGFIRIPFILLRWLQCCLRMSQALLVSFTCRPLPASRSALPCGLSLHACCDADDVHSLCQMLSLVLLGGGPLCRFHCVGTAACFFSSCAFASSLEPYLHTSSGMSMSASGCMQACTHSRAI